MAEDLISSIFNEAAIKKQIADTNKELDDLASRLKTFPTLNIGGGANTLKELNAQNKAYAESLKGISTSTKTVLDAEKLAAVERKRFADERTQQARIATAELKLQQAEIKQKALIEKQAADDEKKAAADAVTAGRERIQQLKAEQAEQERLSQAAQQRNNAEQQALSGTYNPGGGKGNARPASEKLVLTVDQGNILLVKQYENAIAKLAIESKKAKTDFDAGNISQNAYRKIVIENTQKIAGYKNGIADLNKEIKLSEAVNNSQRNSLARAQALILQYTNAKKNLDLSTVEGTRLNENYNKAIDNTNKFILKNADAVTAQSKNVGNYAGSVGKVLNGVLGPLRTLANIIPGLGLGGIFLIAFQAISSAAQALGLFTNKLSDAAKQREILNRLNTDAAESAGKESAQLSILKAQIESTEVPMKTRLQAIKNIKEEYPDYFKGLSNEDLLTGNVAKAYDLATAAILRKAKAQAAAKQLEELATKELGIQQKREQDILDTKEKIIKADNDAAISSGGSAGVGGNLGGVSKEAKRQALLEEFKDREKLRLEERLDIIKQQNFLKKFVIDGAKETVTTTKGAEGKKAEITKESTKEIFNDQFEQEKRNLQRQIKLSDELVNNEELSFEERIRALQNFSTKSIELIDLEAKYEKDALQKKLNAVNTNISRTKSGTERNNLIAERKDLEARLRDLENKSADERLKLFDTNEKKFLTVEQSAISQEEALRKKQYEQELKDAEKRNNDTKNQINDRYLQVLQVIQDNQDKGIISEKEANNQREKIQFDFQVKSIRNELAYAKEILKIQKAAGIDTIKQEQAIADLAFKLEETIIKGTTDSNKNKLLSDEEYAKRKKDLYKQLYAEIAQTVFQFLDDGLKREEQNLEERKRLLDEDTQRRINNINQLGLTETERVKQIAIVEKNAQFQTEQIEKRKRAIQVERAKFEKAASIANIIRSTAEAVISALKVGPPQGFVLAALVGAIGAFQLARAISTPLPKYFKGTDSAKKGLGVFGEIGRELVIPKNGQPYLSPAVESIHNFLGEEKILPADQTARILNTMGRIPHGNKDQIIPIGDLVTAQNRTTKAIEKMRMSVMIQNSERIESTAWFKKHFG